MANELKAHLLQDVQGLEEGDKDVDDLDSGAYGFVFKVSVAGLPCMAKKLHRILTNKEVSVEDRKCIQGKFYEECVLLSKLSHPNIVHFVGVCYGKSKSDLMLVMERLKSDLATFVEKRKNIPISMKVSILLDISYGLLYLHNQTRPLIHRDLTAPNILLTEDCRAKIADLGVSKFLTNPHIIKQTMAPGNLSYMAPETKIRNPQYGTSMDIFSFGHLALHISIQNWPKTFRVFNLREIETGKVEIAERKYVLEEQMTKSHPLYQLAINCLQDEPKLRPSTADLNKTLNQLSTKHPKSPKDVASILEEFQVTVEALSEVKARYDAEVTQVNDELREKNDQLHQYSQRVQTLEDVVEAKTAQVKQYKKQVDQFREQVEVGKEQAQIHKAQVESTVTQTDRLEKENNKLAQEKQQLIERLHNSYSQPPSDHQYQEQLDKFVQTIDDLNMKNGMLLSEIKKRSVVSSQAHPRDSESNPSRQMPGVESTVTQTDHLLKENKKLTYENQQQIGRLRDLEATSQRPGDRQLQEQLDKCVQTVDDLTMKNTMLLSELEELKKRGVVSTQAPPTSSSESNAARQMPGNRSLLPNQVLPNQAAMRPPTHPPQQLLVPHPQQAPHPQRLDPQWKTYRSRGQRLGNDHDDRPAHTGYVDQSHLSMGEPHRRHRTADLGRLSHPQQQNPAYPQGRNLPPPSSNADSQVVGTGGTTRGPYGYPTYSNMPLSSGFGQQGPTSLPPSIGSPTHPTHGQGYGAYQQTDLIERNSPPSSYQSPSTSASQQSNARNQFANRHPGMSHSRRSTDSYHNQSAGGQYRPHTATPIPTPRIQGGSETSGRRPPAHYEEVSTSSDYSTSNQLDKDIDKEIRQEALRVARQGSGEDSQPADGDQYPSTRS